MVTRTAVEPITPEKVERFRAAVAEILGVDLDDHTTVHVSVFFHDQFPGHRDLYLDLIGDGREDCLNEASALVARHRAGCPFSNAEANVFLCLDARATRQLAVPV